MSCGDEVRRMIMKRSFTAGEKPTVPPNEDHRSGLWSPTDVYIGEQFFNVVDGALYTRSNDGIEVVETSENSSKTLYKEVEISSAEILDSYDNPILLLNSEENKYIKIKNLTLETTAGTTPYTFNGTSAEFWSFYFMDGVNNFNYENITRTALFSNTNSTPRAFNLNGGGVTVNGTNVETKGITPGTALYTGMWEANPTLGNGTMLVKIWYTIETFGSNL